MIAEEDDDVDLDNKDKITFSLFKKIVKDKMEDQEKYSEEDALEAFVSMGGQELGEGSIDPAELISVIKEEFDLI